MIQEFLRAEKVVSTLKGDKCSVLHLIWANNALTNQAVQGREHLQTCEVIALVQQTRSRAGRDSSFEDKSSSASDAKSTVGTRLRKARLEAVQAFIALGANVNGKDRFGNTPLHFALAGGKEAIDLLVRNGADFNIPNNTGDTPLHTAVFNVLPKQTWRNGPAFAVAPPVGHLLSMNADVNAQNQIGQTPLQLVGTWTQHHRLSIVEDFIRSGVDWSICDHQGKNFLHCIAERIKAEVEIFDKYPRYLATVQRVMEICPASMLISRYHKDYVLGLPRCQEGYFPFELAMESEREEVALELFKGAFKADREMVEARLRQLEPELQKQTQSPKLMRKKWSSAQMVELLLK